MSTEDSHCGQPKLAIFGGPAFAKEHQWPKWPVITSDDIKIINQAVISGCLSISGDNICARNLLEREFARLFSTFLDVSYCIPMSNGSAALITALEALDVGFGDEVIVPGLTWVATASSVAHVNAIPVLADIDLESLCLDLQHVETLIGQKTVAIIAVHLYGSMVDIIGLQKLAYKYNLNLIEDCSHVHGAQWSGQSAGTFGRCGVFSMQQSKVLTCGEGGAVITNDSLLAERLEQLRADGRILSVNENNDQKPILLEKGNILGSNYALSELQAALLVSQLAKLPEQNKLRARNALFLDALVGRIPGVEPQKVLDDQDFRVLYKYVVRCRPEYFSGLCSQEISLMMTAELGIPVSPIYKPLNNHPLYKPQTKRRFLISEDHWNKLNPTRFKLPFAERAYMEYISFPHNILLAHQDQLGFISKALSKIQKYASEFYHYSKRRDYK